MELFLVIQNIPSAIWIQLGVILSLTAFFAVLSRKVLGYLIQQRSLPEWLHTLCDSFYIPMFWLVWGCGLFLLLQSLIESSHLPISAMAIAKSRNIFSVLFSTWIILRWKFRFKELLIKRSAHHTNAAQDQALIDAIGKVFTVFVLFVAAMMLLDILNVQLTALLAFGGIGGVAIGFAGKDIVANFFGGVMIHLNRHFSVGEWVFSPNKNFEGTVEDIGWYMTRIRTFARRPMYIPNAVFIDAIIENPGRMYNRRIKETIGIRIEDVNKVDSIVNDIRSMLKAHTEIDHSKTLLVHFVSFGGHSLNIEVYCFTKTTNWAEWRDVQQDVFLKIAGIISSHEAQIALPTSTVHLQAEEKECFS